MGTRFKMTRGHWAIVGFVGAVGLITVLVFLGPIVSAVYTNVSDDHCARLASGEPVRNDPDCQNDPWSGVNHIEVWDREHPSP
jgi:hypothetical protein